MVLTKCLNICGVPDIFGGPGGFRKVLEAGRKKIPLFSSESDLMVPSYDHKTQKVNDQKSNEYFNVSMGGVRGTQAPYLKKDVFLMCFWFFYDFEACRSTEVMEVMFWCTQIPP